MQIITLVINTTILKKEIILKIILNSTFIKMLSPPRLIKIKKYKRSKIKITTLTFALAPIIIFI